MKNLKRVSVRWRRPYLTTLSPYFSSPRLDLSPSLISFKKSLSIRQLYDSRLCRKRKKSNHSLKETLASDPVYLIINFLYLVYVLFWQVSSYFTGDHKESLCWTRIILRTVDRKMKLLQRETADKNYFQGYGTNISIKNIFELFIITSKWKQCRIENY